MSNRLLDDESSAEWRQVWGFARLTIGAALELCLRSWQSSAGQSRLGKQRVETLAFG